MAQKKRSNANKKPQKKKAVKAEKDYFLAHVIVSSIVSVLLGIFMYLGGDGALSSLITNGLCGIFGVVAYCIPFTLLATTIYLIYTHSTEQYWKKFVLVTLAIVNLSAIIHLATSTTFDAVASSCGNGGIVGAFVTVNLVKLVQKIASYVILILTFLVLLGAIAGMSTLKTGYEYLHRFALWIYDTYFAYDEAQDIDEDNYSDDIYEPVIPKQTKRRKKPMPKKVRKRPTNPTLDAATSFAEDVKNNPDNTNNTFDDLDISNGIDEVFGNMDTVKTPDVSTAENAKEIKKDTPKTQNADYTIDDTAQSEENEVSEESVKEREKYLTRAEKAQYNSEFDKAIERELIPYSYPPINLLNKQGSTSTDQRMELRKTAEKLINVLDSFGVKAKLLQVTQGPAVTRYEIQPDIGVKLSKISSLADDIALNLAVSTVLVAPVPGKAAVGIEIPNKKVSSVGLRDILTSDDFKNAKSKLTFALGEDIGGSVVIGDIARMPHLLIAGATGSGKSVCINTIIISLLYKADPNEVKLIMVDPKVVELGVYNGIPHLLVPVVTDPKKAAGALNWAVTEMMRRYDLFKETGVRKLESYNRLMESTGGEKVPQLVIIIDELADLMMVAAKEVEDYICRIAQLARAAGIHLIIATQRPSVDVITGLIKANIPSRIAFAVSSQVDSRTILDKGGAEKLLGMGDMLYAPTYEREARRVQGAFVSDGEIEKILNYIKEHSGTDNTYSQDLAEQIERCATGEYGVTPDTEDDGDTLLPEAIKLAVELGKISTSMIQRRLGVGYSRAGRIIDQMESRGIISGANGSKPRDVLISHADMLVNNSGNDEFDDDDEE